MILGLILIPLLAGLLAFLLRDDRLRRGLLVLVAGTHFILTALAWTLRPLSALGGWLALDSLDLLFLSTTSVLFLAAAVYGIGYLSREDCTRRPDVEDGFLFSNAREATFTGCLLLFLSSMTLVAVSQHFGLMWVAVEATTLVSAPLIYFHRQHRSLEAAWKYLVICSVGIAIALLGNFFLVVASGPGVDPLTVAGLTAQAGRLDPVWLRAAFLLLLVGYGTKMGLAPLHTWLPDAHSESPSVISALLSGALLNCAFLAILRGHAVCVAAGQGAFSADLLVLFGLFSMGFAAVFIVGQMDYKRMLAYSSVEHMGIAALGVGLGGAAGLGAILHTMNHSLAKGMLFLLSGNILAAYHSKSASRVTGAIRSLPVTGVLWLVGFFAITGSPPFGLFMSELLILKGALDGHHTVIAVIYLAFLLIIFIGMATVFLRMAFGEGSEAKRTEREPLLAAIPPAVLALGVLLLGLYLPAPLKQAMTEALISLGSH
jgi:hydrogenase-4 component F